MKAIAICQPYAQLFCLPESDPRHKRVENRKRPWSYRGPIAIHAGKSKKFFTADNYGLRQSEMHFGKVVAIGDLVDCFQPAGYMFSMSAFSMNGKQYGGHQERKIYSPAEVVTKYPWLENHRHVEGPHCLVIVNVKPLDVPQPWQGSLGLFDIPDEVIAAGFPQV